MKIGIFGGSFNPPHVKHKKIADKLLENGYIDKLIFVPTGDDYQKNDLIDGVHRYNMLKLICDKDNLLVSDYEVKNGLKYTYETLDYFKSQYPNDEIYFVLGFDNLSYFNKWKNYEYILNNYKLLVISRNDDIFLDFLSDYKDNIVYTNLEKEDVSSSEIRENLKSNRNSNKIDEAVKSYILKHDLYKENLYDFIFKRKSIRKFLDKKIENVDYVLEKVKLYSGISNNVEFSVSLKDYSELKGFNFARAPHYLVVSGKKNQTNLVNIGYILQKWTLWLSSIGLGSVWLGLADTKYEKDTIIVIGFGYAAGNLFRNEEFKRKNVSEIYNGNLKIFEATRLAQSGLNGQPWYFLEKNNFIYVFKKENKIMNMFYSLTDLDIGISLANTAIAFENEKKNFEFVFETDSETLEGYTCVGKILL